MIIVRTNTLPSFDIARPFQEGASSDVYKDRKKWQHMPQLVANQIAEKRRGEYSNVEVSLTAFPGKGSRVLKPSTFNIFRRMDDGGGVIMNTASEAVVLFDEEEANAFTGLKDSIADSGEFIEAMEALGILVDKDEDEFFKFHVLRKRYAYADDDCVNVTIYPTQDCNARCFYCFEQNERKLTMDITTADTVVEYLTNAISPEDEVVFRWFGGEPLYAANVIDHILTKLSSNFKDKLSYHSIVITNASLIDDEMIERFVGLWHVRKVQTTLDGYQEEHDRRKAYVDGRTDTYHSTIKVIGKLLEKGIFTICRFNLDKHNIEDLPKALTDLEPYLGNPNFYVHATTLRSMGEWKPEYRERYFTPADYPEFYETVLTELFERGFFKDPINILPIRARNICLACSSSSFVINAEGRLFRCLEHNLSDGEETGSCSTGIKLNSAYRKWFDMTDNISDECCQCVFLPCCQGGCKHYRMHGKPDARPCLRERFYIDVLLRLVYKSVKG